MHFKYFNPCYLYYLHLLLWEYMGHQFDKAVIILRKMISEDLICNHKQNVSNLRIYF